MAKHVASTQNTEEEVSINLQPYLVPISIIIAGVMISLAVLFSGRNTSLVDNTNTNTGETLGEEYAAGQTTIDDDPYLGNKDSAKVAIVEFSDYECPFCKRHHEEVFPSINETYISTGKVIYVYRDFVAVPSHNPAATAEAYAANCVRELSGDNNKYFQYADLLYTNTQSNGAGLKDTDIYTLGSQVGVNVDQLKTCVESEKYKDEMAKDDADAVAGGIQGTPGFIVGVLGSDGSVNGKIIAGAYPFETFQQIVDEMLAK